MPGKQFLPTLAEDIARWFPELGDRVLAVSDAKINKDNLPTLPLVMLSLSDGAPDAPTNLTQRSTVNNVDRFVIEFWLESNRYVKKDNTESPFWTYYDYESIRARLFAGFDGYTGPNGERIYYVGFGVDASEYAVMITFNMQARYQSCPDQELVDACKLPALKEDGTIIGQSTFLVAICEPRTVYCPEPPTEELDPCRPSA